ncbi:hypothetical protein HYPDE_25028 [Hyphomicrobium denitrificans 1NES1]|uniref:Uncharacterized protein n=1 Tax=Hyphomicrobium denitrificans 1NES1 TaxID=670307 RepID=N0B9E1_9HYPH|nr:hypothetical protein [Hyphomicrobium denitrificans]AGK56690.1 hypothetical protein HYPDE_25028 [Hyphomicrobium denitrificans 1NES1]
MFAALFKRAEQSVDSAIGDLGNRIAITIPFLVALGFAAASLTIYVNRVYGPELGTLIVAGAFCALGFVVALVVKARSRQANTSEATSTNETAPAEEQAATTGTQSIFDDEAVMAVVSSAAPIVIPAMVRTGLKNWPILLAAAAGLYVASRPEPNSAGTQQDPSS